MSVVQYTVKIGGVLMVAMGIMMFTGKMNSFTNYLSTTPESNVEESVDKEAEEGASQSEETVDRGLSPALDFELVDQYGNTHTLSDYEGKVIFVNFWATWCGPCKAELPDIQILYEKYKDSEDVAVIGVAAPDYGQEGSEEEIKAFLEENGITYPVLMDRNQSLFYGYGINAYPTTFMITSDGYVYGAVRGQITYDIMEDIIRQTKEGQ